MAIGITLLEKCETAPRNTVVLFDRFGERKFVYAKVHTCDFAPSMILHPARIFMSQPLTQRAVRWKLAL